jgi:hypothetical protein
MALHNGENVVGETLFGKWVMLGCVHKLKVVYCYCGCLYTIITNFGNVNEHDNVIYSTNFTRTEIFVARERIFWKDVLKAF